MAKVLTAHMSLLTRINSGGFDIDESMTLETIAELHEQEALQDKLFPIEYGLKGLQAINVSSEKLKSQILNGQKFAKQTFEEVIDDTVVMIDSATKKALAIYVPHPTKSDEIKPKKVFN